MKAKFWLKGTLISMSVGTLAALAGWGNGCLNAAIQRILVSVAFD
jgi:hypothetical protein